MNLIGEHTDYNGGYVFPAALTFGTTLIIRPRQDRVIGFASTNLALRKQISIDDLSYQEEDDWINYPKGIFVHLAKAGFPVTQGYDLLFHGEIPNGAGLSSSASIEVVTAFSLLTLEKYPDRYRENRAARSKNRERIRWCQLRHHGPIRCSQWQKRSCDPAHVRYA